MVKEISLSEKQQLKKINFLLLSRFFSFTSLELTYTVLLIPVDSYDIHVYTCSEMAVLSRNTHN